ncbi:hypothetical protein ACFLZ7_01130 [Nanoarchaeota archaeon]
MDIEQLRKVQETADNLKQHNIVESTQEALDQVNKDLNIEGTDVPDINISKTDRKGVEMNDDVQDLRRRLEKHSELISKQAKMIYELQGVVNELIKEVNKLETSEPTKNPRERQKMLDTEEKKDHPRSGGYKPEDVSVEKMFYSGVK